MFVLTFDLIAVKSIGNAVDVCLVALSGLRKNEDLLPIIQQHEDGIAMHNDVWSVNLKTIPYKPVLVAVKFVHAPLYVLYHENSDILFCRALFCHSSRFVLEVS
jgi:hypothetical protein